MKLSEVGKEMWDVQLHTSPMGREALKSANAIFTLGNRLSYKYATGRDLLEAIESADTEISTRLHEVDVSTFDIRERIHWLAVAFCIISLCVAFMMVIVYLMIVVTTGEYPEMMRKDSPLKPLFEIILIIIGE